MTDYSPGDRVLAAGTVNSCDWPTGEISIEFPLHHGVVGIRVAPSAVHPAPPEWAQPWPAGVWLASPDEVRQRELWWRRQPRLDDIARDPDNPDLWRSGLDELPFVARVLAREPIPPHRTVSITLPADATDQAARDEASRVWREAADR